MTLTYFITENITVNKVISNPDSIPKYEIEESHPDIKLLHKTVNTIYDEYENRYSESLDDEIE